MTTVVRAARLFGVTSATPGEDMAVIIDGQQISAVGPYASLSIPDGAEIIDLGDATLLPGLIDAHTHLASNYPASAGGSGLKSNLVRMALHSLGNIQSDLASGVTTLRCMGDPDFMDADFKAAINEGQMLGPELVISTRGVQASKGTMTSQFAVVADGPDAIRKVVRENLEHGADVVKLFVSGGITTPQASACFYSVEEIRAAVKEAHEAGKPVGAHAYGGGTAIRNCIDAGVDMIEHGALIGEEEISDLSNREIWMIVSINVYRHLANISAISERLLREIEQSLKTAVQSGIRFAIATDGMHGALCEDLIAIHGWGIPAVDVLMAATNKAAHVCGISNRTGAIEVGKTANLMAVKGNPIEDMRQLRQTIFVMREGRDVTFLSSVSGSRSPS